MAKFYFTSLGRKPMVLNGRTIHFLTSSTALGRVSGVFKAEDPLDIAVLDDAVRGRRGVSEITEEAYLEAEKKTLQTRPSVNSIASRPRPVRIPTLPEMSVSDKPAGAASSAGATDETLFSGPAPVKPAVGTLVKIGRVNPPKPFGGSDVKVKQAVKRADSAKIRVARRAVDKSASV